MSPRRAQRLAMTRQRLGMNRRRRRSGFWRSPSTRLLRRIGRRKATDSVSGCLCWMVYIVCTDVSYCILVVKYFAFYCPSECKNAACTPLADAFSIVLGRRSTYSTSKTSLKNRQFWVFIFLSSSYRIKNSGPKPGASRTDKTPKNTVTPIAEPNRVARK